MAPTAAGRPPLKSGPEQDGWTAPARAGWCRAHRARRHFRRAGFTLIELLTVITIIAIVATLLMTTLSSVKRKAKEAVCTSNLHQIGLALQIYLDDYSRRPPTLDTLVDTKYLGDAKILRCPADKSSPLLASIKSTDPASPASNASPARHTSYQNPLGWSDAEWNRLMQFHTRAGVVVCTFHDVRRKPGTASVDGAAAPGLILRGQLDGTVVRRQYYTPEATVLVADAENRGSTPPTSSFSNNSSSPGTVAPTTPPWEYFSDEASP